MCGGMLNSFFVANEIQCWEKLTDSRLLAGDEPDAAAVLP